MEKEIVSKLKSRLAMYGAISTNTNTDGAAIDCQGIQGGLMLAMSVLARTDGTYELQILESDDSGMAGATVVDSSQLYSPDGDVSPAVSAADSEGDALVEVGVLFTKRYVAARVVSTSVTTGGTVAVFAVEAPDIAAA